MSTPVVLSYFSQNSNQENEYLDFLQKEYDSIAEAWEQHQIQTESNRYFEVEFPARGNADGEKVAEDIRNYKNRIVVFHFSGHAGCRQIFFKDGSANANGLAGLLGEAQNLKLVFLNGCATYDQVNLLFAKNIKIVIATKGKIKDGVAKEFSSTFYQALSTTQYTIKQAFEHSLNNLKAKHSELENTSTEPIIWRGISTGSEDNLDRWELYVKESSVDEINNVNWWRIGLIKPTSKEILSGNSIQDNLVRWIVILFLILGLAIITYYTFIEKDLLFALFGLAPALCSFFGFKNLQRYKTLQVNSDVVDGNLISKLSFMSK
jgi:hypothetical protein